MSDITEKQAELIAEMRRGQAYRPESTAWEIVENHKGFSVRKCKKGFLAFKDRCQLATQSTVEDAIRSIDDHLERERQAEIARAEQAEWQAKLEAENVERLRMKLEAVLACIQPVRDFVESHGLNVLKDCVQQLELEEQERNVPANWEELVELAERIGEQRCEDEGPDQRDQVGEVDVDKYGVIEHKHWNEYENEYIRTVEYGLQEYIDEFSKDCSRKRKK